MSNMNKGLSRIKMTSINIFELKKISDGKCYDVFPNGFFSPIRKVLRARVFVNVNDKYIILYNDMCEIHMNFLNEISYEEKEIVIKQSSINYNGETIEYKLKESVSDW